MNVDIWLFCEIGQRSQRLFKLKIPNYRTTFKPPLNGRRHHQEQQLFCALGAKNARKFF